MHLLALPDELFLSEIFPYLHSTDLMRAFCALGNFRLVSLVYAHVRHIDLPEEMHCLHLLQSYRWHQIRSLRIAEKHLSRETLAVFPMLEHLRVTMTSPTTRSMSPSLLSLFTRMQRLNLAFADSHELAVDNRFVRYIWHADSRLESLSISSFILTDESYFSSLVPHRCLTRLALVAANLESTIPLLSLTPVLQHLRVRLCGDAPWSTPLQNVLKSTQHLPRIQSLHLIAPGCLTHAHYLCEYIRAFAASLQRLAFYAQLTDSYLMRGRQYFERLLLNDLLELRQLDFFVCSGLATRDVDSRRTFDQWAGQRHVISVFHRGLDQHTRFTLPFAFDRLQRVSNCWLDFHSNEFRPGFALFLPSVTSISFLAKEPLKIDLIRLIVRACPRLLRVDFQMFCRFHDDLVRDTELTLTNIRRLRLCDLYVSHRDATFDRLFRLMPNVEQITVGVMELREIVDTVTSPHVRFATVRQLVIVEDAPHRMANRQVDAQLFSNASVIYQTRSC